MHAGAPLFRIAGECFHEVGGSGTTLYFNPSEINGEMTNASEGRDAWVQHLRTLKERASSPQPKKPPGGGEDE
jgi:hypothetical protein